jgi:hypothetical protein
MSYLMSVCPICGNNHVLTPYENATLALQNRVNIKCAVCYHLYTLIKPGLDSVTYDEQFDIASNFNGSNELLLGETRLMPDSR